MTPGTRVRWLFGIGTVLAAHDQDIGDGDPVEDAEEEMSLMCE